LLLQLPSECLVASHHRTSYSTAAFGADGSFASNTTELWWQQVMERVPQLLGTGT
jgi:hypothetical protein